MIYKVINRTNIVIVAIAAFLILINGFKPDPRLVAFMAFASYLRTSISKTIIRPRQSS